LELNARSGRSDERIGMTSNRRNILSGTGNWGKPAANTDAASIGDHTLAREIDELMLHGRPADAVRNFLKAISDGTLSDDANLPAVAKEAMGATLVQQLIDACAGFACPFCRAGFTLCEHCGGRGRTEGDMPCSHCHSLGAAACDFCAGSGLAGYSFFPRALQVHVALARVERAVRHLAERGTKPSPALARHRQSSKDLLRHYRQLACAWAILKNATDLLQRRSDLPHAASARLVSRCWRGLAKAEADMSRTLTRFVQHVRAGSALRDDDARRFDEERMCLLEEEAGRLWASMKDRMSHFRHRS
jgi:hypothetical protein